MHTLKRRALDYMSHLKQSRISSETLRETTTPHGSAPQAVNDTPFPVELLIHIFDDVSPVDIIRCRAVCRQFKRIIDETPEVLYKIELFAGGFSNNDVNTSTTIPDRLKALQARQLRWKTPGDWIWERTDLHWEGFTGKTQRYDNLWITCHRNRSLPFEETLPAGASSSRFYNEIKFASFEEAACGETAVHSWTLSFPFPFQNFIADLSRRTLYLVYSATARGQQCYRIRTTLFTENTVLSDRLCKAGVEYDLPVRGLYMNASDDWGILLCVTMVGFTAREARAHLSISLLDIKSSDVKVLNTFLRVKESYTAQLAFQLAGDGILLAHVMDGGKFTTEVHMLNDDPLFTTEPWRTQKLQHIATFEYPEVKESYIEAVKAYNCSFTCSDLSLRRAAFFRSVPPQPFIHSHDNDILMICRSFGDRRILHCILISVFTSIQKPLGVSDLPADAAVIPWELWGPDKTRCFDNADTQRYVCIPGSLGHQVLCWDLALFDFNQRDIARDLQYMGEEASKGDEMTRKFQRFALKRLKRPQPPPAAHQDSRVDDVWYPGTQAWIIRQPTVIHQGEMFDKEVITMLPYRKVQLDWDRSRPYPNGLFGGEALVAPSRDGDDIDGLVYYVLRKKE